MDQKKGTSVIGGKRDRLRRALKAKYDQGASIRKLAEETGRSYGFVHRILGEMETVMRPRGGVKKTPNR
ncbi:helix-turn-helix domain-containing protein [Streptomyces sp. NPDC087850]|uniref:helix-turn-helix domain-containing protein n=1 Tax=Streptomyces sp. NPDC087850 TaxID=3365809 RepID=UPI00381FB4A6